MNHEEIDKINNRLERIENLLFVHWKRMLSIEEASILTGLSVSALYKKSSEGTIPVYRPTGKRLYFNREELEAWLQRGRKATAEEIETAASTHVTLKPGGGL